jgi:hypothetical protein
VDATVLATLLCPHEQQASRDCIYRPPSGALAAEAGSPHKLACQRAQQAAPWCSCSPALWQALAGSRHPAAAAALRGAAAHLALSEPQGDDPAAAAGQQHAGARAVEAAVASTWHAACRERGCRACCAAPGPRR